jgi:ribosome-binding factor A
MENKFNFKTKRTKKDNTAKSQRQLRVGEELRHLISNVLHRETFYDVVLENNNITVTEVNVSPDLKNAKVYIMPLGGENKIEVLESLNKIKGYIQKLISSEIQLRQIPRLSFVIDTTFEYANKIDNIIKNIRKND